MSNMKSIPCSYKGCGDRRKHCQTPDEKRDHRMIEVPEEYMGLGFCSIQCACYSGYYDVKTGWIKDPAIPENPSIQS